MSRLSKLRLTRAPRHLARAGLLCWARGRLGRVLVDGLAVRVTRRGRLVVTWPVRRDAGGRRHRLVWPVDRSVRKAVRAQVLAEVRRKLGKVRSLPGASPQQEPEEFAHASASGPNFQTAPEQDAQESGPQLGRGGSHGDQATSERRAP